MSDSITIEKLQGEQYRVTNEVFEACKEVGSFNFLRFNGDTPVNTLINEVQAERVKASLKLFKPSQDKIQINKTKKPLTTSPEAELTKIKVICR